MSTKPAAARETLAPAKPKSDIGPSFFVLDDGPLELEKAPAAAPAAGMILTTPTWVTAVKERWKQLCALPDQYPKITRTLSAVTGVCLVGTLLVMRARTPEAFAPEKDELPPAATALATPQDQAAKTIGYTVPAMPEAKHTAVKATNAKSATADPMATLAALAASLQQDSKEEARLRARNRRLEALVNVLRNRIQRPSVQKAQR